MYYAAKYFTFSSCLPAWSTDTLLDAVYIWYVWVGGGLIPATIVLVSNILAIIQLRKVRNKTINLYYIISATPILY